MKKNKAVLLLKKDLHGQVTINTITRYLQQKGFYVVFYSNDTENEFIKQNNLDDYSKTVQAFTFVEGDTRIVFVNNSLSHENMLYSMLHETAHIVLGHLQEHACDERLAEMQAEAFAYEILSSAKGKNKMIGIGLFIVALLVSGLLFFNYFTPHSDNMVYITPTGAKYHRENCIFTKDKNCTAVTLSEAQKNYSPCSVCNP